MQLRNVLLRAESVEGVVRSKLVVIVAPLGDQIPGIPDDLEAILVQELAPYTPVESLGERVFHGPARPDELVLDPVPVDPGVQCARPELQAVVEYLAVAGSSGLPYLSMA